MDIYTQHRSQRSCECFLAWSFDGFEFLFAEYMTRSIILLHDPYAKIADRTCFSRERLLQACRSILVLIHLISSTTYDVALLDHFSIVRNSAFPYS
jgi:hypothetical protein